MNKPEKESTKETKWQDAWISKLAPDPAKLPDVLFLGGYVGASPDDKAIRLYLDVHLHHGIDIPIDAILHREEIPKTASPLGGSYLWINRTDWAKCKPFKLW